MKKLALVVALALLATPLFAGSWTGHITDEACASKGKGGPDHADCSARCLSKEGAKAVLVTGDGKVVKIANTDKVKAHAGHHVKVSGKLEGDTLTVETVSMVETKSEGKKKG